MPQRAERNPQTAAFLEMLGLPYDLDHVGSAAPAPDAPLAGNHGIVHPVAGFLAAGTHRLLRCPQSCTVLTEQL